MNADDKLLNGSYWEHGVQHSKWIDPAADAVKLLNGSNCTEYEGCKERLEIQTLNQNFDHLSYLRRNLAVSYSKILTQILS